MTKEYIDKKEVQEKDEESSHQCTFIYDAKVSKYSSYFQLLLKTLYEKQQKRPQNLF